MSFTYQRGDEDPPNPKEEEEKLALWEVGTFVRQPVLSSDSVVCVLTFSERLTSLLANRCGRFGSLRLADVPLYLGRSVDSAVKSWVCTELSTKISCGLGETEVKILSNELQEIPRSGTVYVDEDTCIRLMQIQPEEKKTMDQKKPKEIPNVEPPAESVGELLEKAARENKAKALVEQIFEVTKTGTIVADPETVSTLKGLIRLHLAAGYEFIDALVIAKRFMLRLRAPSYDPILDEVTLRPEDMYASESKVSAEEGEAKEADG